jgi:chromosome segregation ATPase
MTIQDQPPREGFGDRLGSFVVRALRLLLRLLVVALLGIALGAGAYLGLPALYRSYVEPVQLNAQRIQELEKALAEAQAAGLEKETAQAGRVADLEGQVVSLGEALQEQSTRMETLAATAEKQRKQLDALDREMNRVDDVESEVEAIGSRLGSLEETLAGEDAPTQQLARQFQLLRALELLTRARLWLTQNNLGLAAKDLTSALSDLQKVQETAPEEEAAVLASVTERIELALGDLNTAPVIAADDIEVAWRMLYEATGQ